ncbi:Cell wall-associated hydrolase, NlpC family [Malonomonas rubra DSM 5091]|uniref:Cell wall-associated hydrolase, NlpC family n=1 Tax=Malonomonas rubra DSM 5091 TaxID=1122189 RepID=A0A1M6IYD4_MALRU|nr:C40 family peptidase [Malonomonas rubra]SHJ39449.1 Cell wall-associated hydrolase, NlpC family [Malonomonas rubra DSM 5091]
MLFIRCSLFFVVLLLLSACAGHQTVQQFDRPSVVSTTASAPELNTAPPKPLTVIATARRMLGTPYRYGGADPRGFDCSGLVSYAYRSVGIRVPRTSSEQFRQAEPVKAKNLKSGDLLFFRLSPPKVSHVAIYDGDGRFIHAPSSGKRVSYASLENPYWRQHLVGAGRF